jgi:hypothetical protein
MGTCQGNAAVVLEPDDDTAALGIGAGVIGTGNVIAITVGGDYEKGLKWTC